MRVLASLSTVALTTFVMSACGLGLGGLGDTDSTEGGTTLDSASTGEGGSSSSGGSSGGSSSGSGGDDGSASGDGNTAGDASGSGSGSSSGGGADSTAPPPDSSVVDTGSPVDSSTPDTYVVETGPTETAPPCTTANNCYVIPANWQLVAFTTSATAPTAACPTGFAMAQPTNLDEGPVTSSACQCGQCTVTSAPTCPTGPIAVDYDVAGGQCGSAGNPSTNKNADPGGCNTDMYTGNFPGITYANMDLKYTPPGATGGSCTSAGTPTGTVTYTAQDRTCVPDSQASAGCTGNQCTLTLGSPYEVCIVQSGSQTCPGAPFTHQHLAGGTATLTCSACGCNASGGCSGTMKLFTSNDCSTTGGAKEYDIPADGTCHNSSSPGNTGSYNSYEYSPKQVTVSCSTSGSSTAQNVTLQNEETICCTQ
jgi:hypothetical protein